MSAWKVNLPLSPNNGSTLSVSYAADLGSLLLLGAPQAMVIAAAGAWTQCTFKIKRRYPFYCTVFSMAGAVITIQATALAYSWLRTSPQPLALTNLPKPIVGIVATHFIVNTTISHDQFGVWKLGLKSGGTPLLLLVRAWGHAPFADGHQAGRRAR